ncbi:sporulation protein YhbH [Kyrpidia sp.]|uniref:sporulation protein YhbH n=1 Tax=Kyrpidia sp. TaxID=2073077 RepID=UPI0025853878|nr:sporulation protein YhbH [Kyrpidia sp.]MCL6576995.1 sporulation protein YhbH [Kyrpidia sp.]
MTEPLFILSQEDWSLHRKGYDDQRRHREKVREAIRRHLSDLIAEESIVLSDGKQVIKLPIRTLDEYRFRFNENKGKQVGAGKGNSRVGDVLGKAGDPVQAGGMGQGAGDAPGMDYYETQVELEEIEEMVFADWRLPNLQKKEEVQSSADGLAWTDVRPKGLTGNLDKRRTLLTHLKRNGLRGDRGLGRIREDDLRYKVWEDHPAPDSRAVIFALMDTSGSMGEFEKYVARTLFFWMTRFLRRQYSHVAIEFIAHHTEAKRVTEEEFFTRGENGGTSCSSAYRLALDLVREEYPPSRYNIYSYHVSDGDNLPSDNDPCLAGINELLNVACAVGFAEVNPYNRPSLLISQLQRLQHPFFRMARIRQRGDILGALSDFFRPDGKEAVS